MRRKDETLRETLLDCARSIATSEGAEAINVRRLATQAGIATGTVYNYFASKEEVLLALTEEYWRGTLKEMQGAIRAESFSGQLKEILAFLRGRISGPAGGWMRSLKDAEAAGRERMGAMQALLQADIARRMREDPSICPEVWSASFTRERYAFFVLRNLLALITAGEDEISFFLEIVNRTLYE